MVRSGSDVYAATKYAVRVISEGDFACNRHLHAGLCSPEFAPIGDPCAEIDLAGRARGVSTSSDGHELSAVLQFKKTKNALQKRSPIRGKYGSGGKSSPCL